MTTEEKEKDLLKIKCGKCNSEYFPRVVMASNSIAKEDCSCPVCGHGKFLENTKQQTKKRILLD